MSKLSHKAKYYTLSTKHLLTRTRRPKVRTKDFFGRTIQGIIRTYKPKKILEIGSWDGRGSTMCLLAKMDYQPQFVRCVEYFSEKAKYIEKNIQPLFPFVEIHNCSSISYEQWSCKDFERDIWSQLSKEEQENMNKDKIFKAWQDNESVLKRVKTSYFDEHPKDDYDFVLIDGGECTGYDEFRLLEKRFNIIALDDVFYAFKSFWAYQELLRDESFELIACSRFVRRGFAAFMRKTGK